MKDLSELQPLSAGVATSYARAVAAVRAALSVDREFAAAAARGTLKQVDSPEELRRVVGAMAHVVIRMCGAVMKARRARVSPTQAVLSALEDIEVEISWRSS